MEWMSSIKRHNFLSHDILNDSWFPAIGIYFINVDAYSFHKKFVSTVHNFLILKYYYKIFVISVLIFMVFDHKLSLL